MGRRVRDASSSLRVSLTAPRIQDVTWADLAWTVVPGLGHIRRRERTIGWVLLGSWAFLLLLAMSTLGLTRSWLLAYGAISVHSLAFSLLLAPTLNTMTLPRRLVIGIALYAALVGAVYYPSLQGVNRVMRMLPVQGLRDGGEIINGDVLLYTGRWTRPAEWRRGDIVVFEIEAQQMQNAIVRAGFGVERIIGLPGDHVVTRKGVVLVNDEPLSEDRLPIRGSAGLPELDIVARRGEFVVLPTSLRWTAQGQQAQEFARDMMKRAARVDESNLLGRVLWRARPWSRAGSV
jgi:signal peptidase I